MLFQSSSPAYFFRIDISLGIQQESHHISASLTYSLVQWRTASDAREIEIESVSTLALTHIKRATTYLVQSPMFTSTLCSRNNLAIFTCPCRAAQ